MEPPEPDTVRSREPSEAIRGLLEEDEAVTRLVAGIGCTLALTERRLLVLRDGASFRPRSGVREWPVGPGLAIKPGVVRQGTGSLVIHWGRDITSVFVRAERWDEAIELVTEVRRRLRGDPPAGG